MAVDGHLNFDTKIDESGFNKGIGKLGKLAGKGIALAGKALAGVTATLGAGIVAGTKYNATIEQYQTSFEVMSGSAEKAADIVKKLTEMGAKTPFEMTGLADTTQLLMNYGLSADGAMDKMMMLGDISQGSADKMNRIAMAYGQMSSAGKVQLQDVKQMIEAGFNPLQEISRTTGESMESLYDRISKGTISVDEITASMERSTSAGGKYFQSMEKQSQTVSGQLSTLKDNVMQLLGSLTSGISKVLGGDILPAINELLGSLNDAFQAGGFQGFLDKLGSAVPAIQGITNALGVVAEKLQGMSTSELLNLGIRAAKMAAAVPAMMLFAKGLGSVVTASEGIGLVTKGIIGGAGKLPSVFTDLGKSAISIVPAFDELRSGFGQMSLSIKNADVAAAIGTSLSGGMSQAKTGVTGIIKAIQPFASLFVSSLGFAAIAGAVVAGFGFLYSNFGSEIDSVLSMVQTKGPQIITDFCNGITQRLPELIAQGAALIQNLLSAITANIPAIVSGGIQIISGLVTGIAQQLPTLIPAALQMIVTLVQALITNIPQLISAGWQLIKGLAQGLLNAIPVLLSAIADAILSIGSSIWDAVKSIFSGGGEEAAEEGKKTGKKYAEGIDRASVDAQTAASNVANATTTSFGAGLDAGSESVNMAGMNLGNSASTGLEMADTAGSFGATGQNAALSLANGIDYATMPANTAGMNLGNSANAGVNSSGMTETYAAAGSDAGMALGTSLTGQAGTVSTAADVVSTSASGVDLNGAYANAGSQAIQSMAGSISSGSGAVSSSAVAVANAAIQGLASVNISGKAKQEGQNFYKSLSDSVKSGTGTVRSSVTSLMTSAKSAATGLGSAGSTLGLQFSVGLANGIRSGQNGVSAAAAQVARAAVLAAKENLDVHSPSKIAIWLGKMFDLGLAKGLIRNTSAVISGGIFMTNSLSREVESSLREMKGTSVESTATMGLRSNISGNGFKQSPNYVGLLDEWETRQKRINRDRDSRPVILNGRQINRTIDRRGEIKA